jgi:hypothetical protein
LDSATKLTVIGWVLASTGFVLESVGTYVSAACSGVSALGYCYYIPNRTDVYGTLLNIGSAAILLVGFSMVVVSELMKKRSREADRVMSPNQPSS